MSTALVIASVTAALKGLLGYAMVALNDTLVLTSEVIRRAGQPIGFAAPVAPLQIALQARYRPTLACEVRAQL